MNALRANIASDEGLGKLSDIFDSFMSSLFTCNVIRCLPLRASLVAARWPGARMRSSAPVAARRAWATSLLRPPSPSQYNTSGVSQRPCWMAQCASNSASLSLSGTSLPSADRTHRSTMWKTLWFRLYKTRSHSASLLDRLGREVDCSVDLPGRSRARHPRHMSQMTVSC